MAIRAGTGLGDLQDVRVLTLDKPDGWITFDVTSEPVEEGEGLWVNYSFILAISMPTVLSSFSKPVHAYVLQIIVVTNHMNGKDTHVRGLRVLGPIEYGPTSCHVNHLLIYPLRSESPYGDDPFPFKSSKYLMYQHLR